MIAIVSDSHIPTRAEKIPEQFREKMKEAELIIHAGDFAEKPVYNSIDEYGELIAVKGNCDFFDLPNSETFQRNQVKFGVYHGTGITPRGNHKTLQKIAVQDLETEILITGHTHHEEITELENCTIINPGTCTGVGGGSSTKSNPTMIELHPQQKEKTFKIKLLELENGKIQEKQTKELNLQH